MPARKLNSYELMNAGRLDEALQSLNQDIETGQALFQNLLLRGLLYRRLNNLKLAIADYTAALDLPVDRDAPSVYYWDANYYRGAAYLAQASFLQAERDLQHYIELY
jgi:tetratricopeptide (TPR) repeat protein